MIGSGKIKKGTQVSGNGEGTFAHLRSPFPPSSVGPLPSLCGSGLRQQDMGDGTVTRLTVKSCT